MTTNCLHCGTVNPPSKARGGKERRFCSQKCSQTVWRLSHPERRAVVVKKYDSSEHGRARRKVWEENNKKILAEKARNRYLSDRARLIAKATARNKANSEDRKLVCKRYDSTENGRRKNLEKRHRRIARIKGAQGAGFTIEQFHELCDFYEDHCLMCTRKFDRSDLEMDHVVPVSRGGRNEIENIQPLCMPCNREKAALTIDFRPTYWWRDGRVLCLENYLAVKALDAAIAARKVRITA